MSSSTEAPANIRVIVRVRPLNENEMKLNPTSALRIDQSGMTNGIIDFGVGKDCTIVGGNASEGTVSIVDQSSNCSGGSGYISGCDSGINAITPTRSFTYDAVFGPNSNQTDIFDSIRGIVEAVCAGYNGTIVAYGQTGSGKTHTIFGEDGFNDNASAGLVQKSLKSIFHKIAESHVENTEELNADCEMINTTTKASFFEIFNERVYDLLSNNNGEWEEALVVREDASKGVYVEGLIEKDVNNTFEAMDILRYGLDNRRSAATSMNRVSSRSHAVFVLTVKSEIKSNNGISKVRMSKFTLVDLAGSERQKSTDAVGDRLKEASMINTSLLCLGQVINSLVDKEKGKQCHVPFRDSKLTFLLRDSWGGNSKTCLVATVSPSISSLSETISTLKFAQRAKLIRNTAVLNEDTCGSVAALHAEIAKLKSELQIRKNSTLSRYSPQKQSTLTQASNDTTVTALCNQNSKLSKKVDVLKEITNQKQAQINSLKRKLQQESLIRKCKERRISYLTEKNKFPGAAAREEVSELLEEITILREQLENLPSESIEWMIKYKEEKAKVDEIEYQRLSDFETKNKEELEAILVTLLHDKDALKEKIEALSSQRSNNLDSILADVNKLERENMNLHLALDQQKLESEMHKEKVTENLKQMGEMQEEMKKAINCLELAQSELASEKANSYSLQESASKMKNEIDKMNAIIHDSKSEKLVTEEELKRKSKEYTEITTALNIKIDNLEEDLNLVLDDNKSLMEKLKETNEELNSDRALIKSIKYERDETIRQLECEKNQQRNDLNDSNLHKEKLQSTMKILEESVERLLKEKSDIADKLEEVTSKNIDLSQQLEISRAQNAAFGVQVRELVAINDKNMNLQDELMYLIEERDEIEDLLDFTSSDLDRTLRLNEELTSSQVNFYDKILGRKDDLINHLNIEMAEHKISINSVSQEKNELENFHIKKSAILESEIVRLKEELLTYENQMLSVQCELEVSKSDCTKCTLEIADLEKDLAEKTAHLISKNEDLEICHTLTKSLLTENEAFKFDLNGATERNAQLESALDQQRVENTNLSSQVKILTSAKIENESLKEELATSKSQAQMFQFELEKTKTDLSKSAIDVADLEKVLAEKTAIMLSRNKELENDLATVKSLLIESDRLEIELKCSSEKVAQLESTLDVLRVENIKLSEQLSDLTCSESENAYLKKELETSKNLVHMLQSDFELTKTNYTKSMLDNADREKEILSRNKELEHDLSVAKTYLIESEKLEFELKNATEKITQLESALTLLRDENSRLSCQPNNFTAIVQNDIYSLKAELVKSKDQIQVLQTELENTKINHFEPMQHLADCEKNSAEVTVQLFSRNEKLEKKLAIAESLLKESERYEFDLKNAREKIIQLESAIDLLRVENTHLSGQANAISAEDAAVLSKNNCMELNNDNDILRSNAVLGLSTLGQLAEGNISLDGVPTSQNAQDESPLQYNDAGGMNESFDESMFLPNILTDENKTPSKTPFKERRDLFSPTIKTPSLRITRSMIKRTPLGNVENAQSSIRKIRTNWSVNDTPF